MMADPVVGLILAAGESSRMGQPKQLLSWGATTLLDHVISQLFDAGCDDVVVVIGAHAKAIRQAISHRELSNLHCILNQDWTAGQSSSLALGVHHIRSRFTPKSVLVALADQPLVTTQHYQSLIESLIRPIRATASRYVDRGGVPACFDVNVLEHLTEIGGDGGAKKWLRSQPKGDVQLVGSEEVPRDIDTPIEYERQCCLQAEGDINEKTQSRMNP